MNVLDIIWLIIQLIVGLSGLKNAFAVLYAL